MGFSDQADFDDGGMWPTACALNGLTADAEARTAALLARADSQVR